MTCHKCKIEAKKAGKDRKGNQRYRCNQCKRRFQEERERFLGNMYLSEEKALLVLTYLHITRRKTESKHPNGNAALYSPDQCFQQEVGEPESRACAVLLLLQFLPDSLFYSLYSGDGSGYYWTYLEDERLAGDTRMKQFKLHNSLAANPIEANDLQSLFATASHMSPEQLQTIERDGQLYLDTASFVSGLCK